MRGLFTVEWLSQSSQGSSSTGPQVPAAELRGPCASGTPPESLPGLYCSRETGSSESPGNAQTHGVHRHPGTPMTQHQDPTLGPLPGAPMSNSQGLSSCAEEETSGYESDGDRSLSPVTPENTPETSPAAGRRPRTAFTVEQINRLERAFKKNAYLGTHDKAELCKKLNLSDKQIRNWFQNRRMKLKRTLQDSMAQACQAKISSQLTHYPQLQAFGPVLPHPGYYPAQDNPAAYASPYGLHYIPPPVGGATMNADSLYHPYSTLPSMYSTTGNDTLGARHYYPVHY